MTLFSRNRNLTHAGSTARRTEAARTAQLRYETMRWRTLVIWELVTLAGALWLAFHAGAWQPAAPPIDWVGLSIHMSIVGLVGLVYRELTLIRLATRLNLPQAYYRDPWGRDGL
jgi:hypothetical protein